MLDGDLDAPAEFHLQRRGLEDVRDASEARRQLLALSGPRVGEVV